MATLKELFSKKVGAKEVNNFDDDLGLFGDGYHEFEDEYDEDEYDEDIY